MSNIELKLPVDSKAINKNEMNDVVGGGMTWNGPWKVLYTDYENMHTKSGAQTAADLIKKKLNWHGISVLDTAKEIFFHADLYRKGKTVGLKDSTELAFWDSLKNGIDLENHLDTAKVLGIERYKYYNAYWG